MTIKRRKTEEVRTCPNTGIDCVVWAIELDDVAIGEAVATYKTPTQRTWDAQMTVDGVTVAVEGVASIARAVTALNDKLAAATADGANIEIVETDSVTA